jgi:hypothetical protein
VFNKKSTTDRDPPINPALLKITFLSHQMGFNITEAVSPHIKICIGLKMTLPNRPTALNKNHPSRYREKSALFSLWLFI